MTFRDVLGGGPAEGVPWHVHDGADISGELVASVIKVLQLLGGTITGKEIIIAGGVDGILRSDNFVAGAAGWRALGDGTWEAQDGIFRGTLNADDLVAGTVTTHRLQLAGENMMPDPGFEGRFQPLDDDDGVWDEAGELTLSYVPVEGDGGDARNGGFALKAADIDAMTVDTNLSLMGKVTDSVASDGRGVLVHEGEKLYFSFYVGDRGSLTGSYVAARIRYRDEAGGSVSSEVGSLVSPPTVSTGAITWGFCEVQGTVPAEAVFAYPLVFIDQSAITGAGHLHIDDVVFRRQTATLMIEDQAVDIERMANPVHNDVGGDLGTNTPLSTTFATTVSDTFTVPSWVGVATFLTVHTLQVTAGATHNVQIKCRHAGLSGGTTQLTLNASDTYSLTAAAERSITSPGSTIAVDGQALLSSGTNSSNQATLASFFSGVR